MARSAAETRPPVEDSATTIVSPRSFSSRLIRSARGNRSFMDAHLVRSEHAGRNKRSALRHSCLAEFTGRGQFACPFRKYSPPRRAETMGTAPRPRTAHRLKRPTEYDHD